MPALDRFSAQADLYARYRIDYPVELYDFLLAQVPRRVRAWDCATGNGQVAAVLATYFEHVDATDISQAQLAQAPALPNITYQLSSAEHTPFADSSFDLITVAQALHWFDQEAFNQEIRRVGHPGATIAEWGYGLVHISPELDPLIQKFHDETMGPYWDDNRWHIVDEYARLPFPFAQVRQAHFPVRRQWSAEWFLNYLRTWSSVAKYQKQHNQQDPVLLIADELTQLWGAGERELQFPVFLRTGLIE
ncbi:Methyltransferase domain-containing protein [Hymenobacter gelipurpurascens]|uniref:Methyltransferase domain-containing protein n=1 Tax=Hymenobacter gelipurpurascens TaxID=89968 RepID=A0A212SZU9_9BACT|nr:class I SAM-dependent methyltransferase [Hymenobacter gelipurpurascens]SNC59308.1 Methyltransferase domain-containing protein [Hymenobacter gelipurpurascens]